MRIIKLINPKLEILEFISINVEFLFGFNFIQDGGEGKKGSLPVFPLELLQTWKIAAKTFWLLVLALLV